jgi:hypothetical protein
LYRGQPARGAARLAARAAAHDRADAGVLLGTFILFRVDADWRKLATFALLRRVPREAFRRVCMGFDALVVAFGSATVLRALDLADAATATALVLSVAAVVVWLDRTIEDFRLWPFDMPARRSRCLR